MTPLPPSQQSDRPNKRACERCGGDMTDGQVRRQDLAIKLEMQTCDELDSLRAYVRTVVENCKHTTVEGIRHQLVGLLPETQPLPPDLEASMREKGMTDLVDLHNSRVQQAWKDYGYGPAQDGPDV